MNQSQIDRIDEINERLGELGNTYEDYFDRDVLDEAISELQEIYYEASDRTQDQADAKNCLDAAIGLLQEIQGNDINEFANYYGQASHYLDQATMPNQEFDDWQ